MTNKKLWQKGKYALHPLVEEYTVGEDYILDKELILYDIKATLAHVHGLAKIKILQPTEVRKIETSLQQLKKDWGDGKIFITVKDEDCHTVIEN